MTVLRANLIPNEGTSFVLEGILYSPNLAAQVALAGQRTQISLRYIHNTYRNVPSCPHEQRATSNT
jgi:hypothetical protein